MDGDVGGFKAILTLSHGDHGHGHEIQFEEHAHAAAGQATTKAADAGGRTTKTAKSDRAVILGLLTLLTFSPCEGFLPSTCPAYPMAGRAS